MIRLLQFLGTAVLAILFAPVVALTGYGAKAPSYAPNHKYRPDGMPNPNYDPSHVKPAPPPPPPPPPPNRDTYEGSLPVESQG